MNNRLWICPTAIILINFALVLFLRGTLPAELPLHISLDGSYAATMPYSRLFLYPAASLVLSFFIYMTASSVFRKKPALDDAVSIRFKLVNVVVTGLTLIILSSTCVSLTQGKVHFFMFAEPVILILVIAAIIVGEIRIRKSS